MGRGAYRRPGEPIVRRDVWHGRPVVGWGGVVVSDTDDQGASWAPDPAWPVPRIPDGWERAA